MHPHIFKGVLTAITSMLFHTSKGDRREIHIATWLFAIFCYYLSVIIWYFLLLLLSVTICYYLLASANIYFIICCHLVYYYGLLLAMMHYCLQLSLIRPCLPLYKIIRDHCMASAIPSVFCMQLLFVSERHLMSSSTNCYHQLWSATICDACDYLVLYPSTNIYYFPRLPDSW